MLGKYTAKNYWVDRSRSSLPKYSEKRSLIGVLQNETTDESKYKITRVHPN